MSEPDTLTTERLPLDGWHRAAGARMVAFAGYEMPIQYDGIMAEHLWTREAAGLFDVSHMGQLVVSGPDADKALEVLLPSDIVGLGQGRMRYSLLLADHGGILDDLMVTRLPADNPFDAPAGALYLVVNGATKTDDIAYLREELDDLITLNHREDQALIALQGPRAVTALAQIVPGVETLVFMRAGAFDWQGTALWISRSGYTGEDGVEISVPADRADALVEALAADETVKPIGLGARDSLRLEAGLPLYGHDLDPDTTPIMAGLGFALSKRRREEGGFLGADRILRERAEGAPVTRVGLLIDGRQPVREGATILNAGGDEIGRVTSGGFAPSLGQPIAMGYVATPHSAPGTALQIAQRGKVHQATVAAMPFVPHRYVREGGK